jgi:pimeloyl-ACP methyl ester carboxylesterase
MDVTPDSSRIDRKLFVVHGVGPFEQGQVVAQVTAAFGEKSFAEIVAFNWDQEVTRVFSQNSLELNKGALSEVSLGFLNAANLGFLDNQPYAGIPRGLLGPLNVVMLGMQLFAWLVLMIVLSRPVLFIEMLAAALLISVVTGFYWCSVRVCARRFLLTLLWPVIHFLAVPLGFGLVYVVVQVALLPAILFVIGQSDTLGAPGWRVLLEVVSNKAASILIFGAGLALARAIHLVVSGPLKAIADVFRYIGVPTYATRLQEGFVEEFERAAAGCNHMVLLTHSLGTVIAVDCLTLHPELVRNLRRVDLVTMGSPLKRYFFALFPTIFMAPAERCALLTARIAHFRWVNVYRPLDYIGGRLGTHPEGCIREIPVEQRLKMHLGYWSDLAVVDAINGALNEGERDSAAPRTVATAMPSQPRPRLEYEGGLHWFWTRRDWPLKTLLGTTLLGLYSWLLVAAVRAWLPPKLGPTVNAAELLYAAVMREEWFKAWPLQVLIGFLGAVALYSIGRAVWKFWIFAVVPYCETLYGRFDAPPIPWGRRPAISEPEPETKTWRRPWVVFSIAGAILLFVAVRAVISHSQWVSVFPATEILDVRSIVFIDGDHLLIAQSNGVQLLPLDGSSPRRIAGFEQVLDSDPIVQLSPDGRYVASIENRYLRESGMPTCVWVVAIPSQARKLVTPCTHEDDAMPVDVAVSSGGDVAVRYDSRRENVTTLVLYRQGSDPMSLGKASKFRATAEALRFDPAGRCLAWRIEKQLQTYCSPTWEPSRTPFTWDKTIDGFYVGAADRFVVASGEDGTRVSVLRADGALLGNEALKGSSLGGLLIVALSPDGERVALMRNNSLRVLLWERHDYWSSAKEVMSQILGIEVWRILHDWIYGEKAPKSSNP